MDIIYNFISSQPLTEQQIEYLNECLLNLPSNDTNNFTDIPEYISVIEQQK